SIPLPRSYIGAGYVSSGSSIVDFMLGTLDEIMLFNRALSGSEINSIYSAGAAGLVRVPEFTGTTVTNSGQFAMNLRGQTGKNFSIYASTNLANWNLLNSVANPTGAIQFI